MTGTRDKAGKAGLIQPVKKTIIRSSPFGSVVVIWSPLLGEPKILRVLLSGPAAVATEQASILFPACDESSCAAIDNVARDIESFFNGQDVRFSLDSVQLDSCSPFQEAVLRAEHGIPRGSVSTYRLIARHLEKPRGGRAVGNALANNPFPIIIPCHRAIRSDRSLGGYQGGPAMKRALLEKGGHRLRPCRAGSGQAVALREIFPLDPGGH